MISFPRLHLIVTESLFNKCNLTVRVRWQLEDMTYWAVGNQGKLVGVAGSLLVGCPFIGEHFCGTNIIMCIKRNWRVV